MAAIRDRLVSDVAARDNYSSLHRHLLSVRPEPESRTTFGELEAILGYRLPDSARLHRPLWSNSKVGTGHGYSLVRQTTGWLTREVGIDAETPAFAYSAGTPGATREGGPETRLQSRPGLPPLGSRAMAGRLHGEPGADIRRHGTPDRRT